MLNPKIELLIKKLVPYIDRTIIIGKLSPGKKLSNRLDRL